MEPNHKSSMAIDAINSLASSFDLLQMNAITGGPINRLPNEMMHVIMAKLGLDGDVKKLIRLRLVSTKWRALVEDYCRLKKSLLVLFNKRAVFEDRTSRFERTFFGFVDFDNFTCLFLSPITPSECLSSLLKMFPNIEQLSIETNCYWPYGLEPILDNCLEDYIKSLDSLKLFDLNGLNEAQLSSVLSKLEHFTYCSNYFSGFGEHPDSIQLIPHLGQSCARVSFGIVAPFVYDQVLQWPSINPHWLANLTHLRMTIVGTGARVVHLLSEHATQLALLHLNTEPLGMTATVIDQLGKLTQLANLQLGVVEMDIAELGETVGRHRFTSLSSVLTCKLYVSDDRTVYSDPFTRVLSAIFPNLVELNLVLSQLSWPAHDFMLQYLNRFPKLQDHHITYY